MNNCRKHEGKLNVVGINIKHYRNKSNISLQRLSDKLMIMGIDIHRQSLYSIERGDRTVVDYELCGIAKCLKIPVDYLLKDYIECLEKGDYQ